jgi:hypothetical protein
MKYWLEVDRAFEWAETLFAYMLVLHLHNVEKVAGAEHIGGTVCLSRQEGCLARNAKTVALLVEDRLRETFAEMLALAVRVDPFGGPVIYYDRKCNELAWPAGDGKKLEAFLAGAAKDIKLPREKP